MAVSVSFRSFRPEPPLAFDHHCPWPVPISSRVFLLDALAQGKPEPDIFVVAAKNLGFSPDRAIVFEVRPATRPVPWPDCPSTPRSRLNRSRSFGAFQGGRNVMVSWWSPVTIVCPGCGVGSASRQAGRIRPDRGSGPRAQ